MKEIYYFMNEKTEGGIIRYIESMSRNLSDNYQVNLVYLDGFFEHNSLASNINLPNVREINLRQQTDRNNLIKSLSEGDNILVFTQVAIAKMFIAFYENNIVFVQYHRHYKGIEKNVKKDLYICEKHIKRGKVQLLGKQNYEERKKGLTEKFTYEKNYVKEIGVSRINDDKKIVYVGRLTREDKNSKNIDQLIEILKDLSEKYQIEIYGDGECYDEINQISENITMKGFEEDIEKIYTSKDLLILPSKSESEGRTVKEAIMAGIPVVVYNATNEYKSMIPNKQIGKVIKMNKTQAFIKAVDKQLEEDTYGKRIFRNKFARDNFGESLIEAEFAELINNLKEYEKYTKFSPKVYLYREDDENLYAVVGGNFFIEKLPVENSEDYLWKGKNAFYFENNYIKLEKRNKSSQVNYKNQKLEMKKIEELTKIPYKAKIYQLIAKGYALKNKDIVLYQDRIDKADDNAEILYEYETLGNAYFVVSKKSESYERLIEKGYNVVDFGSLKHKLLFLNAKLIISSHLQRNMYSPFQYSSYYYYRNFLKYKFVFLQHGVISHDHFYFMNPHRNPVDLFVVSSKYEEKIIRDYGYENVPVTGLARFDRYIQASDESLAQKQEKVMLYFVTWNENYKRALGKSESIKKIESVLRNEELKSLCKRNNIKIKLALHLNILNVLNVEEQEHIEIVDSKEVIFSELLNTSDVLLTDTSSLMYDFAYMKKPVITYTPYKRNYGPKIIENDSFIEDVNTEEEIVSKLEEIIKNNYQYTKNQLEELENFFSKIDKKNRLRIVEEIKKFK